MGAWGGGRGDAPGLAAGERKEAGHQRRGQEEKRRGLRVLRKVFSATAATWRSTGAATRAKDRTAVASAATPVRKAANSHAHENTRRRGTRAPFQCQLCSVPFTVYATLEKHLKKVHGLTHASAGAYSQGPLTDYNSLNIKLEDDSVSDQSGAPITMLTESNADLSEQLKEEDAEMRVSADEPPTSEETGSTVALGQTTV